MRNEQQKWVQCVFNLTNVLALVVAAGCSDKGAASDGRPPDNGGITDQGSTDKAVAMSEGGANEGGTNAKEAGTTTKYCKCTSNWDCASNVGPYRCDATLNICVPVGQPCSVDTDCTTGIKKCIPSLHVCAECEKDSDCTTLVGLSKCLTAVGICASCTKDADCAATPSKSCDPTLNVCSVACTSAADCSSAYPGSNMTCE